MIRNRESDHGVRTGHLSEQLADLSVRAKNAEDAAAAAQKEAHDKVVARVAQAQSAAEEAIKKVNQNVKSASDTTSAKVEWTESENRC